MNISKPFALALALSLSGAAIAQDQPGPPAGPPPDPWGDASVTRAESQTKAGELFDRFDTNRDGVIREAEEEAAAKTAGPGGGRAIVGAMQRSDANGDGKLTRAEFLTGQQERFDRQDADHDGTLTKSERDAARAQMRQRRGGGNPGEGGFGSPGGSGPQ